MELTLLVECNPDDRTEVRDVTVEFDYYPPDRECGTGAEYDIINFEAYTDFEYDNIVQQLHEMNAGPNILEELQYDL